MLSIHTFARLQVGVEPNKRVHENAKASVGAMRAWDYSLSTTTI